MRLLIRQHFKGQVVQAIARQDRRRLVERLVHGRLSPAKIVIVHRRQIVMHQ